MAIIAVVFLIFLVIFLVMFKKIVILIGPGEAGVLYKTFAGGTVVTKVYPEGVNIIYPWNKMFVYNVRVQEVPHEFAVLTRNGLKVELFISIRYNPKYKLLGMLHKKVGEDYVNIVVIPEIENVLRVLIGRLDAEEVYTTKQAIIEKSISEAIEQIAQRYVNVDDVIIKRVLLPDTVAKSIQAKIEQKHIADAYRFRLEREKQEKERKRIEAEGLKIFHKSLSPEVLHWMGIQATLSLAESPNTKTVLVGAGQKGGLPIIGSLPLAPFTEIKEVEKSDKGTDDSPIKEETSGSAGEPKAIDAEKPAEQTPETPKAAGAVETAVDEEVKR